MFDAEELLHLRYGQSTREEMVAVRVPQHARRNVEGKTGFSGAAAHDPIEPSAGGPLAGGRSVEADEQRQVAGVADLSACLDVVCNRRQGETSDRLLSRCAAVAQVYDLGSGINVLEVEVDELRGSDAGTVKRFQHCSGAKRCKIVAARLVQQLLDLVGRKFERGSRLHVNPRHMHEIAGLAEIARLEKFPEASDGADVTRAG